MNVTYLFSDSRSYIQCMKKTDYVNKEKKQEVDSMRESVQENYYAIVSWSDNLHRVSLKRRFST